MKTRHWLLGLVLALVWLAMMTGGAHAAGDTPPTGTPTPTPTATPPPGGQGNNDEEGIEMGEAMGRQAQQLAIGSGVGTAYVITTLAWFATRFILTIAQIVLAGDWSTQLVDTTLQQMQATMPQLLQTILLGQNGLLYLALAVAGITMVFPFLMRGSPVRIDRVFIWAALILALFAGSEAMGYNIISLFEHTRVAILQAALGFGGQDSTGALQNLVLEPWRATPAEAQLDLEFRLPEGFQRMFFPEPEVEDVVVNVAKRWWQSTWTLETPASLEARRDGAFQALFWAAVGIYGCVILGFVAFASAVLTLASLLLIVLFLATLPLALFSFGEALVVRVVYRWVGVVAATIFLGVFLRIVSGWVATLSLVSGELAAVITWFVWMSLMLIAFIRFSHVALDLFAGALLLVGTVAGAMAGGLPQAQEVRGTSTRVALAVGGAALAVANPQLAVGVARYALPALTFASHRSGASGPPHALRGRENVFMAEATT